jgi:hypothetical protein
MAKIRIEQAPTFTIDVEVPRVGGKPAKVPFTFAYKDRNALSAFADEQIQHSKQFAEQVKEEGATVLDLTVKTIDFQVKHLAEIIVGWGFEDELNEQSIRALVCSASSVPDAILKAYQAAYADARLGN